MRRKDRQVTDRDEILGILERCGTIRIAFRGDEQPYAVPVSFGMEAADGRTVLYFHCARQGLKVDLARKHPRVCVEGDIFHGIEKTAHGITARYESVIGFGQCSFAEDPDEILHGMDVLTRHYGYPGYPLDRCAGLEHLLVGKIVLDEITGKKNLPGSPTPADRAAQAKGKNKSEE